MPHPTISIVVPTFNRDSFLPIAVDSVLAQTCQDWELFVIDDGSTDSTRDVMRAYQSDERINYQFQENKGQATARNAGLKQCTGEYVCFLDSDNIWTAEKLEEQLDLFRTRKDVDVIYGDADLVDEHGGLIQRNTMKRYSGQITMHLLRDNCVSFNTAMIRRPAIQRIGGFDEEVRRGDDYDLWLRMSRYSAFLYVPRVWEKYRIMQDQISTDTEGRLQSNFETIERFITKNRDFVTPGMERHARGHFYIRRGRCRLEEGDLSHSFGDFRKAIRTLPFSQLSWRAMAKWVVCYIRAKLFAGRA